MLRRARRVVESGVGARGFALALIVAAAPPASAGTGIQPPPEAQLHLRGVVVQERGGAALLQFGARRPRTLRVGESAWGFTLVEVSATGAVLRGADGAPIGLTFPDPAAKPAPGPPPAVAAEEIREAGAPAPATTGSPRGDKPWSGAPPEGDAPPPGPPPARAVAGGERRFVRDDVRLRLAAELPRILTGAVVAPRVRGRDVVGLELVAFPADTLLGETGLVPGDVLLEVNGREVRGMESLAVLAQRFKTARELELRVDRGGELLSLRYLIE